MSKPYMISYDLHLPGQKYGDVKNVIENFGGYSIKILESTWLVRNSLTPTQMVDRIQSVVDKNDSIFIAEITSSRQGLLTDSQWANISKNIYQS